MQCQRLVRDSVDWQRPRRRTTRQQTAWGLKPELPTPSRDIQVGGGGGKKNEGESPRLRVTGANRGGLSPNRSPRLRLPRSVLGSVPPATGESEAVMKPEYQSHNSTRGKVGKWTNLSSRPNHKLSKSKFNSSSMPLGTAGGIFLTGESELLPAPDDALTLGQGQEST